LLLISSRQRRNVRLQTPRRSAIAFIGKPASAPLLRNLSLYCDPPLQLDLLVLCLEEIALFVNMSSIAATTSGRFGYAE
jgi:hypothetical protein